MLPDIIEKKSDGETQVGRPAPEIHIMTKIRDSDKNKKSSNPLIL